MRLLAWTCAALSAAVLSSCGGGDTAPDSLSAPDQEELGGAPCPACRSGVLSGTASAGGALSDAEVTVHDRAGRSARGRTGAGGRFEVDVTTLSGPLLVQVAGLAQGAPVRLHAPARAAEVGKRALNVTPLTELISAVVLGGMPAELIRDARLDLMRVSDAALRNSESRIEAMVRPILDLAGVPALVELRLSAMPVDGSGIDAALHLLELDIDERGYLLRHIGQAATEGLAIDPAGGDSALGFAPPTAEVAARAKAALAALPALNAAAERMTALLQRDGSADSDALSAELDPGLRHQGLDRGAYVARVLQRRDAAADGGYSLQGARWGPVRVLQADTAGRLRVRVQVTPQAPFENYAETLWVVSSAAGWRWLGDGASGQVQVRHVAILAPQALTEAQVRALGNVQCSTDPALALECTIAGGDAGSGGVPAGGWLELGAPGDALFGALGVYRSTAPDAETRLQAARSGTRLLAAPSQRVEAHLRFEVDARRVDPRARKVLVSGPGLPPSGVALVPPENGVNGPLNEHWVLESGRGEDWQAVRRGWCDWAAAPAAGQACAQAWSGLRHGTPYRFSFFDAAGALLQEQQARVQDAPRAEADLFTQRAQWFARFDLSQRPAQTPSFANVLGWDSQGDALLLQLPWLRPQGAQVRPLQAQIEWQRAAFPSADARQTLLRRTALTATAAANAGGDRLDDALAPRPGYRSTWLVVRLVATDFAGSRYIHFVAPNNPH